MYWAFANDWDAIWTFSATISASADVNLAYRTNLVFSAATATCLTTVFTPVGCLPAISGCANIAAHVWNVNTNALNCG